MSEKDEVSKLIEGQIFNQRVSEFELRIAIVRILLSQDQWVREIKSRIGDVHVLDPKLTVSRVIYVCLNESSKDNHVHFNLSKLDILNVAGIVIWMRNNSINIDTVSSWICRIDVLDLIEFHILNVELRNRLNFNVVCVLIQPIFTESRLSKWEDIELTLSHNSLRSWEGVFKE